MSVPAPAVARLPVAQLRTGAIHGRRARAETFRLLARNRSAVVGGCVLLVRAPDYEAILLCSRETARRIRDRRREAYHG